MNDQIVQKLKHLRAEFEAGQQMLKELEQRKTNLEHTLLRISGAIQVLEELRETASTSIDGQEVEVKSFAANQTEKTRNP